MATVTRMKNVELSVGNRMVGLCRRVEIHRERDTVEYPVYRDSAKTKTLRTLEKIRVILEKVYQEKQDFIDILGDSGLSFEMTTGGETHSVTGGTIIDYKLEGNLAGELIEIITISAEECS
jgi:hypothetical protein